MRLLLLLLAVVPAIAHAREEAPLGDPGRFPLRHTHVQAEVAGPLADVEVVQSFENRHDRPIEVVYTFPLHPDAAVRAMEIHVGERIVRGSVKRRAEAQAAMIRPTGRGSPAEDIKQSRPVRRSRCLSSGVVAEQASNTARGTLEPSSFSVVLPISCALLTSRMGPRAG